MVQVRFACGHSRSVTFPVRLCPLQRNRTLSLLARSTCPSCLRELRQRVAQQQCRAVGLPPLRGNTPQVVGLAEQIRAAVVRAYMEQEASPTSEVLALLATRRDAGWWCVRRMALWSELHCRALVSELQTESEEKP